MESTRSIRAIQVTLRLLFVGVLVTACGTRPVGHSPRPHVGASSSTASSSTVVLPSAPTCPSSSTTPPPPNISIAMSKANDSFSVSCYYAPANVPFAITFENGLVQTSDNSPISLRLVISPSDDPVFTGSSSEPGMFMGDFSKASYVSPPVTGTASLSVPALASGTYDIQTTTLRPMEVVATLTVS